MGGEGWRGRWVGAERDAAGPQVTGSRAQLSQRRDGPHLHARRVELLHDVSAQHLQLHALDL
jgi:hypothetical protein